MSIKGLLSYLIVLPFVTSAVPESAPAELPAGHAAALRNQALMQKAQAPAHKIAVDSTMSDQQVLRSVMSSSVTIRTRGGDGLNRGSGSGFFVAPHVVATNYHVVDEITSAYVEVYNSGKTLPVTKILATDPANDLALLYVPDNGLKPLTMGSDKTLQIGDEVFAVGAPLGLTLTASAGMLSSYANGDLLQITAPISPGNSGGPLVNSNGEVVGVVCAYYAGGQNINLAIRVSKLKQLMVEAMLPA